jgi:hypothetical protein
MSDEGHLHVSSPSRVRLSVGVCDATGRLVVARQEYRLPAGPSDVPLNLKHVPAGVYFCRLEAGTTILTHKLVVR